MTTATATIMNQFDRRPTYNEMIEMIEEEELKVKPSIENVIDRKATFFRNNQYGGRFDNADMIGLQKQEQMRQLKMLKEATMREAMFNDPDRVRFTTPTAPAGAGPLPPLTPAGGFQTPPEINEELAQDEEFIFRMNQELREYEERQKRLSQLDRSQADGMLSTVSQEELPQGARQFMIGTPPQTSSRASRASGEVSSSTQAISQPLQTMDELPPNVVEEQQPASSSQIPPPMPAVEDSRILDNIKELHPDLDENEQQQAFSTLNKVKDKTSRIYANNISSMTNTVEELVALEMISPTDYEEFLGLKTTLKEAKGKEAKDEVREDIGEWYNDNVYLKYIASKKVVKGARSKAMAKAKQVGKKLVGQALVEGGARLLDSQLGGGGDVVRGVANMLG